MKYRPSFMKNSLIVVAHPDDELLWFGSIMKDVDEILVVFEDFWPDPSIGPARSKALETFPRSNISSLKLGEAATYGCADWNNPKLTRYGIDLGTEAAKRSLKHQVLRTIGKSAAPAGGIAAHYKRNYRAIVEALRDRLSADMNVFTHNPWGEYGHEDHIQVFQALNVLRDEIGFKLWMSNYCTERSLPLAMRYMERRKRKHVRLPVDKEFAAEVMACYQEAGCWTWDDNWVWFDEECFMEAPSEPSETTQHAHLFPLNMFLIDAE